MTAIPRRPASVAIDGDRVRQIRESRGLTQLYIAEVVQVSVDTVSRWENKRTQTIRVDNAAALAQALEVPLEEITLAASENEPTPVRQRTRARLWGVLAFVCVLAAVVVGWWMLGTGKPVLQASRRLPAYTAPGTTIPVLVQVRVVSGELNRLIVREQLPPGWVFVGAAPPPDQGPGSAGELRWILPAAARQVTVAYVVRPPAGAAESSAHRFTGQVIPPGRSGNPVPIRGETRIDLEYIYWADEDADFQVGDAEVLDALERIEAVPDLGVGSEGLRALWGAAEYRWDAEAGQFKPSP